MKQPPLTVIDKPELEFARGGQTQTVRLVSADSWTAECSAAWCNVSETSGDRTASDGITLHITADNNDSGANREATVTIKSGGKVACTIKVFQSLY